MKGSKGDKEVSRRGISPSKSTKTRTCKDNKKVSKSKLSYIIAITEGTYQPNLPSKEMMKRKIMDIMVVYPNEGSRISVETFTRKRSRPSNQWKGSQTRDTCESLQAL